MRKTIRLLLFLVAVIIIALSWFLLFKDSTYLEDYKNAQSAYDKANKIDYDAQKRENELLKLQITQAQKDTVSAEGNLVSIQAEHAAKTIQLKDQKTKELNEQATILNIELSDVQSRVDNFDMPVKEEVVFDIASSDMIFTLLNNSVKDSMVDIVTFHNDDPKNGTYSIKVAGYLSDVTEVFNVLSESLKQYDASIGNFSLRQVYDVYGNERSWDDITRVDWYNNQTIIGEGETAELVNYKAYINEYGEVVRFDGGYEIEGVKLTGKGTAETTENLELAKKVALQKLKEKYEADQKALEKARVTAIVEIHAYENASEAALEALLKSIEKYYDKRDADLKTTYEQDIIAITALYDRRIEVIKYEPPVEVEEVEDETNSKGSNKKDKEEDE